MDEAPCRGWIDGVRRRTDDDRYPIRFTPRRTGRIWSKVNAARVRVPIEQGRMQAAGLQAYQARYANRTGIRSCEQSGGEWAAPCRRLLERNRRARDFLAAQAAYRKRVYRWIMGAKREDTRLARAGKRAAASAAGARLAEFVSGRTGR